MSVLYEPCPLCNPGPPPIPLPGRCLSCGGERYIRVGLTTGQVDLIRRQQREAEAEAEDLRDALRQIAEADGSRRYLTPADRAELVRNVSDVYDTLFPPRKEPRP